MLFDFSRVPDVVWSGLLASGLTLLGVMISNWSNTRRLLRQLDHDSVEKERDRINALRREVYLKSAEEAAKVNSYLGKIPQLDPAKENIANGLSEFFGVAAKLQLVAQSHTSQLAGELVIRYGELLLRLLERASPIHDLNIAIRIAGEFCERNQADVARILAEMRQINESGEPSPARFSALNRSFEHAQRNANRFAEERSKAYEQHAAEMREYVIYLLKEVRSIAPIQMQLSMALRGELNLTTDVASYEARMQENLDRMDKAIQGFLSQMGSA